MLWNIEDGTLHALEGSGTPQAPVRGSSVNSVQSVPLNP
jgi:hypothetical protein